MVSTGAKTYICLWSMINFIYGGYTKSYGDILPIPSKVELIDSTG
jgi:hypothetical protein